MTSALALLALLDAALAGDASAAWAASSDSIVRIEATRRPVAPALDQLGRLHGVVLGPSWKRPVQGDGTGFVVEGGLVATNHHLVAGAVSITLTDQEGRGWRADVVASDAARDVALLRVDGHPGWSPLAWSPTDPHLGTPVVTVGFPLGAEPVLSSGVVSGSTTRAIAETYTRTWLLTDALVRPGHSGGALLDARGRLLGMVTAGFSDERTAGLGVVIPADDLRQSIDALRRRDASRAIGVEAEAVIGVDDDADRPGVLVTAVLPASPAATAGLRVGDVVIAVDGRRVRTSRQLADAVRGAPAGRPPWTVNRDHADIELRVAVGARPPELLLTADELERSAALRVFRDREGACAVGTAP